MKNKRKNLTGALVAPLLLVYACAAPCEVVVKEDCVCTFQYNPVCGCNGKTYGNACEAECRGIKDYTPGECQ